MKNKITSFRMQRYCFLLEYARNLTEKVQFCKLYFAKLKKNMVKCIFFTEKFGSMKYIL